MDIGELKGKLTLEDKFTEVLERADKSLGKWDKSLEDIDKRLDATQKTLDDTAAHALSFGDIVGGVFSGEVLATGFEKSLDLIKDKLVETVDWIKDITMEGAKVADIEDNFGRLTSQVGMTNDVLVQLRKGTHDTVTDLQLMKTVNQDLAAGMTLTSVQLRTMADGAFALAQATGTNTVDAFEKMNTALLHGRARSLEMLTGRVDLKAAEEAYAKSLGTTADHLSAEGKLQADRLGMLQAIGKATDRLGEQTDGLDEIVDQVNTTWKNFEDDLGKTIATNPALITGFTAVRDVLLEAFGDDKKDLIAAINDIVTKLSLAAVDLASTMVDGARNIVMAWTDVKTVVETVMQALHGAQLASLYVARTMSLPGGDQWKQQNAEIGTLLNTMMEGRKRLNDDIADLNGGVDKRFDAYIANLHELRDRMANAQKDIDALSGTGFKPGFQGPLQGGEIPLDRNTIVGPLPEMAPSGPLALGPQTHETKHDVSAALKKEAEALKIVSKAWQDYDDAVIASNPYDKKSAAVDRWYHDQIVALDKAKLGQKDYFDALAGYAATYSQKMANVGMDQAKQFEKGLKENSKFFEDEWKRQGDAHKKNLEEEYAMERQHTDDIAKLALNSTDFKKQQLTEWVNDEEGKLDYSVEGWQDAYNRIHQVAKDKLQQIVNEDSVATSTMFKARKDALADWGASQKAAVDTWVDNEEGKLDYSTEGWQTHFEQIHKTAEQAMAGVKAAVDKTAEDIQRDADLLDVKIKFTFVGPEKPPDFAFERTKADLNSLSSALAQLGQISNSTMTGMGKEILGVASALGTVVGAANVAVEGFHAIGEAIGLLEKASGVLAIISAALRIGEAIWNLVKNIGGPSQAELDARKLEATFEQSMGGFDKMMTDVGQAYLATGRTLAQAQADVKSLLDAEKQGPEATQAWIDRITKVMTQSKAMADAATAAMASLPGEFNDIIAGALEGSIKQWDDVKKAVDDATAATKVHGDVYSEVIAKMRPSEYGELHKAALDAGTTDQSMLSQQAVLYNHVPEGDPRLKMGMSGDTLSAINQASDVFSQAIDRMSSSERDALLAGMQGFKGTAQEFLAQQTALYSYAKEGDERLKTWLSSDTIAFITASKAGKDLVDALAAQQKAADAARQKLEGLGMMAESAFGVAYASGKNFADSLDAAGPGLDQLIKAFKDLGIAPKDPFLGILMSERQMMQNAPALFKGVSSLGDALKGMQSLNILNASSFKTVQGTAMDMFTQLQGEAAKTTSDIGEIQKKALLPMQDYLHQAEQAAKDLNIPLDDTTQMLIDQSKELGIWKDKGKSSMDIMTDAIKTLVDKMSDFLTKLGLLPADKTVDINVNTNYHTSGTPPATPSGDSTSGNPAGDHSADGVPTPDVPAFATEAYVRAPTLAMVGDVAGGEFVLKPATLTKWVNEGVAGVTQAIQKAVAATQQQGVAQTGTSMFDQLQAGAGKFGDASADVMASMAKYLRDAVGPADDLKHALDGTTQVLNTQQTEFTTWTNRGRSSMGELTTATSTFDKSLGDLPLERTVDIGINPTNTNDAGKKIADQLNVIPDDKHITLDALKTPSTDTAFKDVTQGLQLIPNNKDIFFHADPTNTKQIISDVNADFKEVPNSKDIFFHTDPTNSREVISGIGGDVKAIPNDKDILFHADPTNSRAIVYDIEKSIKDIPSDKSIFLHADPTNSRQIIYDVDKSIHDIPDDKNILVNVDPTNSRAILYDIDQNLRGIPNEKDILIAANPTNTLSVLHDVINAFKLLPDGKTITLITDPTNSLGVISEIDGGLKAIPNDKSIFFHVDPTNSRAIIYDIEKNVKDIPTDKSIFLHADPTNSRQIIYDVDKSIHDIPDDKNILVHVDPLNSRAIIYEIDQTLRAIPDEKDILIAANPTNTLLVFRDVINGFKLLPDGKTIVLAADPTNTDQVFKNVMFELSLLPTRTTLIIEAVTNFDAVYQDIIDKINTLPHVIDVQVHFDSTDAAKPGGAGGAGNGGIGTGNGPGGSVPTGGGHAPAGGGIGTGNGTGGSIHMASGGIMDVLQPTTFLVGEAGPEQAMFSGEGQTVEERFGKQQPTAPQPPIILKQYMDRKQFAEIMWDTPLDGGDLERKARNTMRTLGG